MPLAILRRHIRLRRRALLGLGMALSVLASGCHRHRPRPAPIQPPPRARAAPSPGGHGRAAPPPAPIVQGEEGIASWYGHPFHGRRTASGEIYNMYAMTAAHRTLPFGTVVRVHDLESGKSVVVRINDRGPFVEGRIIDLSYSAAQAMGMSGTALVRLEIIGNQSAPVSQPSSSRAPSRPAPALPAPALSAPAASSASGVFSVQIGAFQDRRNAEKLMAQIPRSYGPLTIQPFDRGDGVFYRVRVGSESTEDGANQLARRLRDAGLATQTFVVRND
jgi:peptidoglycan lytic transglycosylase